MAAPTVMPGQKLGDWQRTPSGRVSYDHREEEAPLQPSVLPEIEGLQPFTASFVPKREARGDLSAWRANLEETRALLDALAHHVGGDDAPGVVGLEVAADQDAPVHYDQGVIRVAPVVARAWSNALAGGVAWGVDHYLALWALTHAALHGALIGERSDHADDTALDEACVEVASAHFMPSILLGSGIAADGDVRRVLGLPIVLLRNGDFWPRRLLAYPLEVRQLARMIAIARNVNPGAGGTERLYGFLMRDAVRLCSTPMERRYDALLDELTQQPEQRSASEDAMRDYMVSAEPPRVFAERLMEVALANAPRDDADDDAGGADSAEGGGADGTAEEQPRGGSLPAGLPAPRGDGPEQRPPRKPTSPGVVPDVMKKGMGDGHDIPLPAHLAALSPSERESMCVQCGACCHAAVPDADGVSRYIPGLACRYLAFEGDESRCTVYDMRHDDAVAGGWCRELPVAISRHVFPAACPYVRDLPGYVGPVLPEPGTDLVQLAAPARGHPAIRPEDWIAFDALQAARRR